MATDDKVLLLNCIVNIRILMIHQVYCLYSSMDVIETIAIAIAVTYTCKQ